MQRIAVDVRQLAGCPRTRRGISSGASTSTSPTSSCPRRSEPTGCDPGDAGRRQAVAAPAARGSSPGRAARGEPRLASAGARRRSSLRFARRSPEPPGSPSTATAAARSRRTRDAERRVQLRPVVRSRPRPTRRASANRRAGRRPPIRGAPSRRPRTCGADVSDSAGLGFRRRMREQRPEVRRRSRCAATATMRCGVGEEPRFRRVAANGRQRRRGRRASRAERQVWRRRISRDAIASLSARQARASPVSAPPWFRSADWRPATPRCRP